MNTEVKGLSKKLDKNIVLPAFAETLESFCGQMLPNGHRDGDKWICGNLQNDEGDSCAIWLDSGTFNDSNPAADHVKGGPADLWRALFGEMSFPVVLRGMEQWMKDGTLPDGAKGRPTKNASSKKRTLSERREELLQDVARMHGAIEWREKSIKWLKEGGDVEGEPRMNEIMWSWMHPDERTMLIETIHPDFIVQHRIWLERFQTQLDVVDWLMCPPEERLSAYTQDVIEQSEVLSKICEWRGISPDAFQWLAQHRYFGVGTHYWFDNDAQLFSDEGKLSLGVWCQTTAVFPIYNGQGKLTSFHHRILPNGAWQPKVPWFVEPAGEKLSPMIIGDVPTADLVVIAESTWDAIAYLDLHKLWTWTEDTWCVIATRGAANAQRIPAEQIKEGAVVMRLLQNDDSNAAWVASLPPIPQSTHRQIKPPDEDKDLNDWIKRVGPQQVLKTLQKK